MDQQGKTYNLVNAASSLKNYEFDFGNLAGSLGSGLGSKGSTSKGSMGNISGVGGTSLKQQKMETGMGTAPTGSLGSAQATQPNLAAPIAPNFRPMAAPWEVAAEKMKAQATESISVAPTQTVQAAFKEKAATVAGGPTWTGASTVAPQSGASSQPSWMAGYVSSVQPGVAMGKPDPLANLWSSAATSAAPLGAPRAAAGGQVSSGGGASGGGGLSGGSGDPFDFISGGKTSLSAMKSSKNAAAGPPGPSGQGSAGAGQSLAGSGQSSAGAGPFSDFTAMKSSMPPSSMPPSGTPARAAASVAGSSAALADPFAQFGQSGGASGFPSGNGFGDFSSSGPGAAGATGAAAADPFGDPFGSFPSAAPATTSSSASGFADFNVSSSTPTSSSGDMPAAASSDGFDDFLGAPPKSSPAFAAPAAPAAASAFSNDGFDALFGTAPAAAAASPAMGGGGVATDDWGAVFGESAVSVDQGGGTVELEGLPPPPAGLTAPTACDKGEGCHKAGQFADAIKWLLWAEALVGAPGGDPGKQELLRRVLTTRAACYKEAGEMKKAVADFTQVLEFDPKNTTVLMQRAVLYEGMEKYSKGVEDLREVLRLDPGNRPAMNMLNRLSKMA